MFAKNDEKACLLCTHDTSNERETNQQETNDQNAKMSCLQWKNKPFIQEMSKWHVCYAHTIHQNQPHFLA